MARSNKAGAARLPVAVSPAPKPSGPAGRLNGRALEKWTELSRLMLEQQAIREGEFDLLELYCATYGIWSEAAEKVRTQGSIARDARNAVIVSPWVEIRDDAADRMASLAAQLGLTPGTRRVPLMPDFEVFMEMAALPSEQDLARMKAGGAP